MIDSIVIKNRIYIVTSIFYCLMTSYLWKHGLGTGFVVDVCLLPILFVVILRSPAFSCVGFILFTYFRLHDILPYVSAMHLPFVFGCFMLFALIVKTFTRLADVYWARELTLLIIFFFILTVGVLFAVNRHMAFEAWKIMIPGVTLVVLSISWQIRTQFDFSIIKKGILLSGVILGAVAVQNNFFGVDLVGDRVTIAHDVSSVLGDPNDLALVLLLPVSFALASFLSNESTIRNKIWDFIAMIFPLCGILVTQSRGGLLGLLSVIAVFTYKKVNSKFLLVIFFTILLVLYSGIASRSIWGIGGGWS